MDTILAVFGEIGKEARKAISLEKGGKEIVGKNPLGQKSLAMDTILEDLAIEILKKNKIGKILVTEEKGDVLLDESASGVLALDPLDGSDNYSKNIPVYCLGIAYSIDGFSGGITHSYVINLVSGDEFWAIKGKGAFMNGGKIRTSEQDDLSKSRMAIDYNNVMGKFSEALPLVEQIKDIRRMGPDILDMCYVANGGYEGFIDTRNRLSVIHICGAKIAEEAGAVVSDSRGNPINVKLSINSYLNIVCCANKCIYEKVMKLIRCTV